MEVKSLVSQYFRRSGNNLTVCRLAGPGRGGPGRGGALFDPRENVIFVSLGAGRRLLGPRWPLIIFTFVFINSGYSAARIAYCIPHRNHKYIVGAGETAHHITRQASAISELYYEHFEVNCKNLLLTV